MRPLVLHSTGTDGGSEAEDETFRALLLHHEAEHGRHGGGDGDDRAALHVACAPLSASGMCFFLECPMGS